jgi:hypothetical protein
MAKVVRNMSNASVRRSISFGSLGAKSCLFPDFHLGFYYYYYCNAAGGIQCVAHARNVLCH